jgi:hypothetical protein
MKTILGFRAATVGDADSAADVYLPSRKELVACAPLVHSDEEVRDWIRRHPGNEEGCPDILYE